MSPSNRKRVPRAGKSPRRNRKGRFGKKSPRNGKVGRFLRTIHSRGKEEHMSRETVENCLGDESLILEAAEVCHGLNHPGLSEAAEQLLRANFLEKLDLDSLLEDEEEDVVHDPKELLGSRLRGVLDCEARARNCEKSLSDLHSQISDLLEDLRALEQALEGAVCLNLAQAADLRGKLSLVYKELLKLPVLVEQIISQNKKSLRKIDLTLFRKRVRSSISNLKGAVKDINDKIEEYNDDYRKLSIFATCSNCMLRAYIKTFFPRFHLIRFIALKISKKFPNLSQTMEGRVDELAAEISDLEAAVQDKFESYLKAKGDLAFCDQHSGSINSFNGAVERVNRLKSAIAHRLRTLSSRLGGLKKFPNNAEEPDCGDPRSSSTKLRILGFSRTLRSEASAYVTRAISILEAAQPVIEDARATSLGVAGLCSETRALFSYEGAQEAPDPLENKVDRVRVRETTTFVSSLQRNLPPLLQPNYENPRNIDLLLGIVDQFGGSSSRELSDSVSEVLRLRTVLSSGDLIAEDRAVEVLGRLFRLERRLGLDEDEHHLVHNLWLSSEGALKLALGIYGGGRYCVGLEEDVFRSSVQELLAHPRKRTSIGDSRATRFRLAELAIPLLENSGSSIFTLIPRFGELPLVVIDHADKHAAGVGSPSVTQEFDLSEANCWEKLRKGDSAYSARALGVNLRDSKVVELHYAYALRKVIEEAPMFLSTYYGSMDARRMLNLFFVRDMTPHGLEGILLYTCFCTQPERRRLSWQTAYLTTVAKFTGSGSLSLITPLSRSFL